VTASSRNVSKTPTAPCAPAYARHATSKIILIDGPKLAELMVEYNVGVTASKTYELKQINADYFSEA
jgi:restriction system protein